MNKKSILWLLLDLIFLAVFDVVFFFVGGGAHPASVWVSFAFIHIAYVMVVATPILTRKCKSASVFGFSLYNISTIYFFIEYVVGIIFVLIGSSEMGAALVVQLIIWGIYAIMLIANLLLNEYSGEDEQKQADGEYIKNATSRVAMLVDKASDRKAKKTIEKASELLQASPVKSDKSLKTIEAEIMARVVEIENALDENDGAAAAESANKLIDLVEKRNKKLKRLS